MPIRRETPQTAIDRYIWEMVERRKEALAYNLCAVGEQVVNEARDKGSYKDWTGNLRSSTGYVVSIDGQVYKAGEFKTVHGPDGDGSGGKAAGESFARSLVKNFPEGVALIVVAGMRYASYVSAKGRDVLDSAELLAKRLVPEMLRQLGIK